MELPDRSDDVNGRGETAAEFSSRLSRQISGGMTCLGIAMGVETGLFRVMVSFGGEPKNSEEIASASNLKERYVREWLGCMVASDIINFDATRERYWLPVHRSSILQCATLAMAIPCLSGGFFDVAACFKNDGPKGMDYDKYPKLVGVLDRLHEPFFRDQYLQEFLPSVPKLVQQLKQGIQVLEVGCCDGESVRMLATRYPNSYVYGVDISPNAINQAKAKTRDKGITNTEFICQDVCLMAADWTWKFDFVFVYFVIHDLSYPSKGLKEIHRVLKPGGTLSVVDTVSRTRLEDNLKSPDRDYVLTQFTMSLMSCLPASLHSGDGTGLGAMWGQEKAEEMLQIANFEVLSVSTTNAKLNGLHYLCRKPSNDGHSGTNIMCANGVA